MQGIDDLPAAAGGGAGGLSHLPEEINMLGGDGPDDAAKERHRLHDAIRALANEKERLGQEVADKRTEIEERWLADLRQYYGRYDEATERNLKNGKKSRLFARITRSKCRVWEARLTDLLFPTDDKNWGIQPTPRPELSMALRVHGHETAQHQSAKSIMDEAKSRAEAMETEIDDQLRECQYQALCRETIHDAILLGTGILKGPVLEDHTRRMWMKLPGMEPGAGEMWALKEVDDKRPAFRRIDPWSFFPDPNGRKPDEWEFTFERHLPTAKELRAWARKPGFDVGAIRRLLAGRPLNTTPQYITQLRSITQETSQSVNNRYTVWEYRGPITAEQLRDLWSWRGDDAMAVSTMQEFDDPLIEIQVVMFVCQGEVLKFALHPLDSQETVYSTFCFEKDEGSTWGFGVPALMRDSQAAVNAAWRMMLDNGGLSTGPQIVIKKDAVEPQDGDWTIRPRKIWWQTKDVPANTRVFDAYHIDSRQTELANIINIAKQFADEETSLPVIAQGEQGAHTSQTANGMAMLMNSANVVFRAVVKNYDDDMTTPNLRRLYDWNMQFSPREEIKGDMTIDARGSSVLLVRELQAQNLMTMVAQFSAHPVLGPLMKVPAAFRKMVQAHMLPADDIVKTDDEIQAEQSEQAQAAPEDPAIALEAMKHQNAMELAQQEGQMRIQVEEIRRETAMAQLAAEQNLRLEDIQAKMRMHREKQAGDERKMAAEMGFKAREQRAAAAQAQQQGRTSPDVGTGTVAPILPGTRYAP